jgi:arylsulfatase A-like enzyme
MRLSSVLLVVCATAIPSGSCGPSAEPARPTSVLWISLDTLRADRLSCYGNEHATSPAIDTLAREGVLFERAISTSSWTLPAHISMLTGLPISAHGVCFHTYGGSHQPLRGTFVSEILKDAGYATAGFYSHRYLDRSFFSGTRFDTWERTGDLYHETQKLRREWEAATAAGKRKEAKRIRDEHHAIFEKGSPEAADGVDRALGWLGERLGEDRERPFLLFLHIFDVHTPYVPPPPFDRRFDPDYDGELTGEINVDVASSKVVAGMAQRDLDHVLALYDGEIAWVDSQIGRLLEQLDALGVADDTLVILTSDHGEEFLEHDLTGHHKTLYRESIQVPLILRLPGRLPAGARLEDPVSILDLAPTVLAELGLAGVGELPGIDLAALARGETAAPDRTLVSELVRLTDTGDDYWKLSLYRADEHVIVSELGTPEEEARVFDLTANPLEQGFGRAIAPDSEEGRALSADIEAVRARLTALRAAAHERSGDAVELSELDQSELEALGYTGFDVEASEETGRLCMDGCVWREP